jgi:hypothetical protein
MREHRMRHRPLVQHVERERNQPASVFLREVGDRSDEARARPAHFMTRLGNAALAEDGAVLLPAVLAERFQRAQRRGVIDRGDQNAFGPASPQMLAHHLQRVLEPAPRLEPYRRQGARARQHTGQAVQDARQPRLQNRPADLGGEHEQFVHVTVPVLRRPVSQVDAPHVARLITVASEIDSTGVRIVDGDQRNTGAREFLRYGAGDIGNELKLDGQIDALPDQRVGIPQRQLAPCAVIHHHQADPRGFRGCLKRFGDRADVGDHRALFRITDAKLLRLERAKARPVSTGADPLQETLALQRRQQPERGDFVESGSLRDFSKSEDLIRLPKRSEHIAGPLHRRDTVVRLVRFAGPGLWPPLHEEYRILASRRCGNNGRAIGPKPADKLRTATAAAPDATARG